MKTKNRPITDNQLRAVQATMVRYCNSREERIEMLTTLCGRPITGTRELTSEEANMILAHLGDGRLQAINSKKCHLRATIYHLSMQTDFLNAGYPDNGDPAEKAMNCAKVDMWLLKHGTVKKRVKDMTVKELGITIGQLKTIKGNRLTVEAQTDKVPAEAKRQIDKLI